MPFAAPSGDQTREERSLRDAKSPLFHFVSSLLFADVSTLTQACTSSPEDCSWTNDTWCDGDGYDSEWCADQGGWCDPSAFAPKNCWQYDDNEASCNSTEGCEWHDEGSGDKWCEEKGCWDYDTDKTACDLADGCAWQYNDWGESC